MKKYLLVFILFFSTVSVVSAYPGDRVGVIKNIWSSSNVFMFSIPVTDPAANALGVFEVWMCINITNNGQPDNVGNLRLISAVVAAMATKTEVSVGYSENCAYRITTNKL